MGLLWIFGAPIVAGVQMQKVRCYEGEDYTGFIAALGVMDIARSFAHVVSSTSTVIKTIKDGYMCDTTGNGVDLVVSEAVSTGQGSRPLSETPKCKAPPMDGGDPLQRLTEHFFNFHLAMMRFLLKKTCTLHAGYLSAVNLPEVKRQISVASNCVLTATSRGLVDNVTDIVKTNWREGAIRLGAQLSKWFLLFALDGGLPSKARTMGRNLRHALSDFHNRKLQIDAEFQVLHDREMAVWDNEEYRSDLSPVRRHLARKVVASQAQFKRAIELFNWAWFKTQKYCPTPIGEKQD